MVADAWLPSELLCGRQRLIDVPQDVVQGFQPDRHADHVRGDARLELFFIAHLPVGGRGRMNDQGLGIADIGQMTHEAGSLDEFLASGASIARGTGADAEVEQARGTARQIALRQGVMPVTRQAGVVDPGHARIVLQRFGYGQRVGAMPVHAQRQRLHALDQHPGVERRHHGYHRLRAG